MSAYIKTLKNTDGDIIYPQTKTSAVYTNDGHNIEEYFGKADAVKLQGVDTSGYEKFWRGTKAQYDALTTKSEEILYIITDDNYALDSHMSENYSSANTYEIRDICLYNNKLYRCTTAITSPEAWNEAHWTETNIGGEIKLLKSGKAAVSYSALVTLLAASWSTGSYTLTNEHITATNVVEILPAEGITADQLKAAQKANIVGGTQTAGSMSLIALGTVPTIDIPVKFVFRGDL